MGIFSDFFGFGPIEQKADLQTRVITLQDRPVDAVRRDLSAEQFGDIGLNAVQISAVFACAKALSEGLAQIPCILQRRSATGGYEPAIDHPVFKLLSRNPNSFQNGFEFREWLGFQLALNGNAYVYIARVKDHPVELIPLPAGSVKATRDADHEVTYTCSAINNGNAAIPSKNIWHLKGSSLNGFSGLDPQHVAARAIGLANSLETFGSQVFAQGVRPSGILTIKDEMTPEQLASLKQAFEDQYAGLANAQRTLVLSAASQFQATSASADDAQYIESRRYQTEEICRIMGVDPLMIGQATGAASYGSIEQRFLAHHTYTLRPLFARFEQSAENALLTKEEQDKGYRVYLDTRELTMAVASDRAAYYATMRQNGLMTINECREHAGLDRSSDALADRLTPSANLFGKLDAPASTPDKASS